MNEAADARRCLMRTRVAQRHCAAALVLVLAACASPQDPLPTAIEPMTSGPASTSVAVVQRDWHTDICLRMGDADPWVASLARGFEGAAMLCFGFGERQFVVERRHDPLTMMGALLPSKAAVLMTVLRASPQDAFGAPNVVEVPVDSGGLAGLQRYLRASFETDASGATQILANGPYAGSVYFAASGTYDAFHTCNTWTARALRSAGLMEAQDVLFAGSLMREVRAALKATRPDNTTRNATAGE